MGGGLGQLLHNVRAYIRYKDVAGSVERQPLRLVEALKRQRDLDSRRGQFQDLIAEFIAHDHVPRSVHGHPVGAIEAAEWQCLLDAGSEAEDLIGGVAGDHPRAVPIQGNAKGLTQPVEG